MLVTWLLFKPIFWRKGPKFVHGRENLKRKEFSLIYPGSVRVIFFVTYRYLLVIFFFLHWIDALVCHVTVAFFNGLSSCLWAGHCSVIGIFSLLSCSKLLFIFRYGFFVPLFSSLLFHLDVFFLVPTSAFFFVVFIFHFFFILF